MFPGDCNLVQSNAEKWVFLHVNQKPKHYITLFWSRTVNLPRNEKARMFWVEAIQKGLFFYISWVFWPWMAVVNSIYTKETSQAKEILEEYNNPMKQEGMKFSWTGNRRTKHDSISSVDSNSSSDSPFPDSPNCTASRMNTAKKTCGRKRGRRPSKIDLEAKLERSRQSARECRARKKLRYKYLEDMIADKESYVYKLREELEMVRNTVIDLKKFSYLRWEIW